MVKVKYLGLLDPRAEVEALRPAATTLANWRLKFKPQGPEYLAICEAIAALDKVGVVIGAQTVSHEQANCPLGGLLQPFKEVIHWDPERPGNAVQCGSADPVHAALVFLHLLERHLNVVRELLLADAHLFAPQSDPSADMLVNVAGGTLNFHHSYQLF